MELIGLVVLKRLLDGCFESIEDPNRLRFVVVVVVVVRG